MTPTGGLPAGGITAGMVTATGPVTPAATPPAAAPTTLMKILSDVEVAFTVLGSFGTLLPGAAAVATIGAKIDSIILAGLAARQAVVGAPLDLTKLQEITPV